jgi:hypothetical protein
MYGCSNKELKNQMAGTFHWLYYKWKCWNKTFLNTWTVLKLPGSVFCAASLYDFAIASKQIILGRFLQRSSNLTTPQFGNIITLFVLLKTECYKYQNKGWNPVAWYPYRTSPIAETQRNEGLIYGQCTQLIHVAWEEKQYLFETMNKNRLKFQIYVFTDKTVG